MWLVFASLASVLWGLSYVFSEQVYRYASIYTVLAINLLISAIAFLILAAVLGVLRTDLTAITNSNRALFLFLSGVVIFCLAELFIGLSIAGKSATLAGLIEITYPLFIALFAYLLFKEHDLNWGIAFGGLCIFIGVAIVYWFSR